MENISIHFEAGAREFAERLIGRTFSDAELAAAVGALDGSRLHVSIRKDTELAVEVKNEKVIEQIRWLRRDQAGDLYIWNFRLEKAPGFYSIGLASFLRQIKAARALGFHRIECYAAGHINDLRYNGYFHWARYGYDAPLTVEEQSSLSDDPRLAGARTVNELILRGGLEWWRLKGLERKMVFVLDEKSSMMSVLKLYLEQHHPDLLEEL
ncbi:MAG: hypothetical protein ACREEM_02670 [Blastocatellia bacterium]